jgi:hypothetical protein
MASTEFHRDEARKTVETVLALSIRSVRPYPWLQTGRGAGIDDSPERIRSLYGPVLLKQPVNAEKPRGIPMAYCFSDQSELVFGIEDDKVASILVAVSAK